MVLAHGHRAKHRLPFPECPAYYDTDRSVVDLEEPTGVLVPPEQIVEQLLKWVTMSFLNGYGQTLHHIIITNKSPGRPK